MVTIETLSPPGAPTSTPPILMRPPYPSTVQTKLCKRCSRCSAAIKSENNREQGENRRKEARVLRARHCKYEVTLPPRSFSLSLSLILSLLRGKQNFTIRSVSLSEPVNRHLFRRSLLHQRSIPVENGDKDGGQIPESPESSSDSLSIFHGTISGLNCI